MALAQVQPSPIVPKTIEDQEGVRSTMDHIKGKLRDTVKAAKDSVKVGLRRVIDKAKKKIKDKINDKAAKMS